MSTPFYQQIQENLKAVKNEGLYKSERIIISPQQAVIKTADGREMINFCANNYLGLANHPELVAAAKSGLEEFGFGMASVRFICGTQSPHKKLEEALSRFLGTEDTILYSSCFDANGGLFEAILGKEDAIISDQLNHASIIDGVRLCKAQRFRYHNNDMADLEKQLIAAGDARHKMIATDGVFSMDGIIADLESICMLAQKHNALVMVDDCHATGFMGKNGRGTHEHCGVMGKVDVITGTLGKALGGASGGFTSGRKEIVDWLRQRSRPYLFSNALAPAITTASIKVLEMLGKSGELRKTLRENSAYFRARMTDLGFNLAGKDHPIIPVMIGDAALAAKMADRMLEKGVYVVGFSYPVVPKGAARIRTQMCAAHTRDHLDRAIDAFRDIGKELAII